MAIDSQRLGINADTFANVYDQITKDVPFDMVKDMLMSSGLSEPQAQAAYDDIRKRAIGRGDMLEQANILITAGGEENLREAADILNRTFPGLDVDFDKLITEETKGDIKDAGKFYRDMISAVNDVLSNIKKYYPDYNGKGYDLLGFGWHQGWNDRVNSDFVAEYEANCINFINDLRKDLKKSDLPFVLAITGQGGWADDLSDKAKELMVAQLAVDSSKSGLKNVASVETRDFWIESEDSPGPQSCHWNQNAGSYFDIGDGMAKAMIKFMGGK